MLCPASAQLSSNRLARGRVRACASAAARSAASEFKVSGVRLRTRGPEVARFRSRPLSPQKLERWETHSGAYRVGGGVMEIRHEDGARSRSPTLSSSWDASCGSLARSLRLRRAGVDARDLDCDELLAPPAPGCARRDQARARARARPRSAGGAGWAGGRGSGRGAQSRGPGAAHGSRIRASIPTPAERRRPRGRTRVGAAVEPPSARVAQDAPARRWGSAPRAWAPSGCRCAFGAGRQQWRGPEPSAGSPAERRGAPQGP